MQFVQYFFSAKAYGGWTAELKWLVISDAVSLAVRVKETNLCMLEMLKTLCHFTCTEKLCISLLDNYVKSQKKYRIMTFIFAKIHFKGYEHLQYLNLLFLFYLPYPVFLLFSFSYCDDFLCDLIPPVSQTRQPVFVQLLQGVFRVYHCSWLSPAQKHSVEGCIKVLSDVGKYQNWCS